MLSGWSNFINEIFSNTDNNKPRDIAPIEKIDKTKIIALNEVDAQILWRFFFPETAKYALLFERTYGEPSEISLFEENEVNLNECKKLLASMHDAEAPILIYWNSRVALETCWSMLIKYWENFFYYPEDAIIFVDQKHIYFYNEMSLKKLTEAKSRDISDKSVFDCLQQLKVSELRKSKQIDCLFEGVPDSFHDKLFRFFNVMSESFSVIEDEAVLQEYAEYCLATCKYVTEKIILASKPYNKESLQNFINEIEVKKKDCDITLRHFYEILIKIANKQL